MSQPSWVLLDATDFYAIFHDSTGIYTEEAEITEESGARSFTVYRFPLDRLKLVGGHLVSEKYSRDWPHSLASYTEWFAGSLSVVAKSIGGEKSKLIEALCSPDPFRRFWAYHAIGGYHGFTNFDSYPIQRNERELGKRWS